MKKHDLKDDIGYWLNRLRIQVHQAFEERLAAHDTTVAQWCILLTLYNQDAASTTELSKFIEVDKASISRVLDRLVSKGFVVHGPGVDRRSGYIQLTAKGRELVPHLIQAAKENEHQFFGCLSKGEKEQFRQIFKKLLHPIPSIQLGGWLSEKE